MGIIAELRRRNVFRVGVAYAVLAWVVIQVTDTVAPALGLPDWALSFVVWLGIVGFPFVVLVAWMYQLTPQGIVRDEGEAESGEHLQARRSLNLSRAFNRRRRRCPGTWSWPTWRACRPDHSFRLVAGGRRSAR